LLFHDFICFFAFYANQKEMRLLLISNSTMSGESFLEYPKHEIRKFIGPDTTQALFIPYAAVTLSYEEYEKKVNEKFNEIGHSIVSIHRSENPVESVNHAQLIVVGGGNTWQLVRKLRELNLFKPIRKKVKQGMPYIGWSAGANIACPTLTTTNDMPITDPMGFDTLGLVPFQINPHYSEIQPEGHAGETRRQRIEEYILINKNVTVVGLREGSMLKIENKRIQLIGNSPLKVFRYGFDASEVTDDQELSVLLQY
jgi:dipeptidase E